MRDGTGSGSATRPPSFQAVSAGRISVAIWPGGTIAAATASRAVGADIARRVGEVCTQCDIGRAMPSMSAVSGASSAMC